MGQDIIKNKNTDMKKKMLTKSEVTEFQNVSSFSEQIIVKLHNHYSLFCAVHSDDGVIDYSEFCYLINKMDNTLSRRIFKSIDTNNDQVINFREFIKFFGTFCSGTLEEKVNLSFKIFSDTETKLINSETMYKIIHDIVKSERKINSYFDKQTIVLIVENTFSKFFPVEDIKTGNKSVQFENNNVVKEKLINENKINNPNNLSKGQEIKQEENQVSKIRPNISSSNIKNSEYSNVNSNLISFKVKGNTDNNIKSSISSNSIVTSNELINGQHNIKISNMNFEQYKELVEKNQEILEWLKLDLEHIKNAKINPNTGIIKSKSHC